MTLSVKTRIALLVGVLLVLPAAGAYWPVGGFDFISVDDTSYVVQNPNVTGGLTWDGVAWAFTAAHSANWHPLTWISHMVDVELHGLNPGGHHVTNLLLHIANVVLLFYLLLLLTGCVWRSAFVAALFAVHPLNVESVAWIAERKNVLSTFFLLLTIITYARYTAHRTSGRYALVLIVYALGLMSKPMLVTLPLVLILVDHWPLNQISKYRISSIISKLPLLALALASCIITLMVQKEGGMTRPLEQFTVGERAVNALVSYVAYIVKMFRPTDLCLLYPHPGNTIPVWKVIGSGVLLAGATAAALLAAKRRRYLATGWFWYLITLVPVIGLVQVGPQAMADRYAYVPLIGIFIVITWGVADAMSRVASTRALRPVAVITAVALIGTLAVSTRQQLSHWKNGGAVFERVMDVTDEHLPTVACFAASMANAGMTDDAIRVLRTSKDPARLCNGVAVLMARVGMGDHATPFYREAISIDPTFAQAHNNLGTLLARRGNAAQAAEHFRTAIRIDPKYALPHHSLGVLAYDRGDYKSAITHFKSALRLDPDLTSTRARLDQAQQAARKSEQTSPPK